MLNWSLVVCTLNRRELLAESLRSAIKQTRLPKQIIVVDASNNWESAKAYILDSLAGDAESIEWIYVGSEQKSLTYQRNVGLKYCESDVVFFLDDDAFMYPDCAEEIMQVYELDKSLLVGGVTALLANLPPGPVANQVQNEKGVESPSLWNRILRPFHKFWSSEQLFIPYDGQYYTYDISELAKQIPILSEVTLHGCRMTFRTSAVKEAGGFDEVLIRGAIAEDDDISYKVSRKYALVAAERAKIFHQETEIVRLKRYTNTVLLILNIIVLFLLNTTIQSGVSFLVYRFAIKRLLLEFVRDCAKPQRGFAHVRGALYAVFWLPKILQMDKEQLRDWYPRFQAELMDKKQAFRNSATISTVS
ncbi:MAG TPA: glycosyltransferase [Coleofasciculaceae cyanobacterium]